MQFLETTKLWDWNDWDVGKFYSEPLASCASWSGSWLSLWSYQDSCFQCSSGKFLDLDTMTWVSSWNLTSQVQITDSLLKNIPLWRSFSYYVNPLSTSQTELGTKQHPYKDINYALAEIFNFHSGTNRSISLYIMEDTTNYIMSNSYINNMTLLTILPYSVTGTTTNKAKIVGVDSTTKMIKYSMPTKMIINPSLTLN